MKTEWQNFLQDAGAEIENNRVISFGNPEREQRVLHSGLIICDLSHFGLIAAYGEDAADFLQGQLTNDIRDVSTQHSQLSAACTPKGRMLANFRIFKRDETFYLRLPASLLESILKRLKMFTLMSKVTLEDASQALVRIGVSGPSADEHLGDMISDLPQADDDSCQCNGYTIIRVAGIHPRYEIYGELDDMQKLWNHLDVHGAPVGAAAWSMLDILAGIPNIYPETTEAFVPQMLNMQAINGVNFQKGCYTGQEVVARMQYLGKAKRRMFHIQFNTSETVKPGDRLYAADSTSGQGPGTIVDAQANADGSYEALAVINIADTEKPGLKLHDENGADIVIKELPYKVPEK